MTRDNNIDPFGQPIECLPHYSDAHREQIATIVDWLADENKDVTEPKHIKTQSWLARLSRLKPPTVNLVLSGKYPSPPDAQLKSMVDAITDYNRQRESSNGGIFVETSVYRLMHNVCSRAAAVGSFGIVSGYVGVGKTKAAFEYARKYSHAHIIEATPDMTSSVFLNALMDELKVIGGGSPSKRFTAIVAALKGTTKLLIIDEAETMSHKCLHILRRIRDVAGVGIVLVGTEKLGALISPHHGEFDQIRSRVTIWPPTVTEIKREDADALAQAALDEQGELSGEVLDALWSYSKGSARMLTENLIPSIKDFGLAKGNELNAALVAAIAKQTLNLKAA